MLVHLFFHSVEILGTDDETMEWWTHVDVQEGTHLGSLNELVFETNTS